MKNKELKLGLLFILSFIIWTISLLMIDVKPLGVNQTHIGLSTMNVSFHQLTGTNMFLYISHQVFFVLQVFSLTFFSPLFI